MLPLEAVWDIATNLLQGSFPEDLVRIVSKGWLLLCLVEAFRKYMINGLSPKAKAQTVYLRLFSMIFKPCIISLIVDSMNENCKK